MDPSGRDLGGVDALARPGRQASRSQLDEAIRPVRGQVIATEPVGRMLYPCPHYARRGFDYWQQTPDTRLVLGGRRDKSLDLELTPERHQRLMDAYLTLDTFPDVRPGLETLNQRGVRLAILSNGEPGMLRAAAQHAGILPLLDEVISTEEVGTFKPSPRVYELASIRMSLAAEEIGFVSANSWDIAGARSAGLTTFWVQRAATETGEEQGFPAHHVIRAITDLTLWSG